MRKILITGGNGFIGRNLKEKMQGKYSLFAPSHKELDILDYNHLFRYVVDNKIDVIIHSAVHVPRFNGYEHEMLNDLLMFWNLEKISGMVEKIIYFGSGAEFDKRYNITNVAEEDLGSSIPITEYGLAKYTMTKWARNSKNIYNIRLFGIFGKYELWDVKFLSNLCCKAIFGLPLSIRKDCSFNFVFVEDLVQVVEWLIDNDPLYHDYNFCHDLNYKLTELAQMIRFISGKSLEIVLLSDDINLDYTASNLRLRREMNALEITSMEKALVSLYQYYCDIKESIDYSILQKTR